jgi:hypothetical protein
MFFRKRTKNATERVEDLKARVDSLRHLDETRNARPKSLNDFLSGDDVVTARDPELDASVPEQAGRSQIEDEEPYEEDEVDLEAELERYLARERERGSAADQEPVSDEERPSEPQEPPEKPAAEWTRWTEDDRPPPPPQSF